MLDADRDGALSRVEFSIAVHLASCSANKGLPVPSALPGSLAALLPGRESHCEQRTPVARKSDKIITRGEPNQASEKSSAQSPDEGYRGSSHPHRSIEAGGKDAGKAAGGGAGREAETSNSGHAAARNKAGGQAAGEGGDQGERNRGTKKSGTQKEIKPSKKRGFGIFSSPAGTTTDAKKRPSTDNERLTSKPAPAAHDRGGKNKKRPKKGVAGDQRGNSQESNEVAAGTGKRTSSSGDKQRAGSKLLLTASSSKAGKKEADRAEETAVGGGVGGFVAGSDPTERIAQGEGRGTGEDGSSIVENHHQLAETGDGDDEGAGTQEGNTPKKNSKSKKKTLSTEERDQLYAMTTSERARYDVIFMQVLTRFACSLR